MKVGEPRPQIRALEQLLARKKQLTSLGVSLDGYHRWGNGGDPEFEARATRELAELPEVKQKLAAMVGDLKASDPQILVEWADAHLALLEDYLERVPEKSTEAFVAREERTKWRKVRAGKLDYVEENPVYVKPDPDVYERLFGFPPPHLHW